MAKGSLLHWGPLVALSIIFILFLGSVYSSLIWWPPNNASGVSNIVLLIVFLSCIVYNFVKAAWVGPGYVPNEWKPANDDDQKLMQFCQICVGYKVPRSHHCRQCNRCVMKMDHHCPWINHCVGHKNHKRFTLFLFFVVVGCSYAAYSLIGCVYTIFSTVNPYVYQRLVENNFVSFGFYHLLGMVFCIGLDLGVIIAVGILLYYQMRDIIRNESSIEGWIVEKSSYRSKQDGEFVYPYNLGRWENVKQVIHFSGDFIGDGITWPVVEGCNQYTLTVEQLRQKNIKKHYAIEYRSIEDFDGSFCGLSQGFRVCICFPWSLERRLKFQKDDHILVTRWRRHWLYGVKMEDNDEEVKDPEKGWFPRICAVRDDENENLDWNKKKEEKEKEEKPKEDKKKK